MSHLGLITLIMRHGIKKLVNDVKKAIGEKRYINTEKYAFEIGQGDINSIITLAIQDIRDDAGDFDQ